MSTKYLKAYHLAMADSASVLVERLEVRRRVEAVHARVWTTQLQMRSTPVCTWFTCIVPHPNLLPHPRIPTSSTQTRSISRLRCLAGLICSLKLVPAAAALV